ncbi:Cro/CI family transcriptional regulator [Comamonas testosteroni]|uniref:Cro/Cl family transcriptional regulator n=1 Tax=Comamonas testosteroni TaxID=285 RepID=A0A096GPF5_COMTE|nr:Cro/CI family transcriptional regulator [Comamonas testosteroni]KGH27040.1 hypothetical protein P353_19825 [Comamonas testosteroni]
MNKAEAIQQLGGSIPAAAKAIGVSYQAVNQWPEVLPARIVDRVQAALWRMQQAEQAAPVSPTTTTQEA